MTEKRVYKILTSQQWEEALQSGNFRGAPVDLADGYIHFSARDQVKETAEKHFHGQTNLLLVAFDASAFGDALKWEPSRGGALFPHLYGDMEVSRALSVVKLPERSDGGHEFPEEY